LFRADLARFPALGARPDWPPGSIIYRGAEPNLRVVDVIPADDPEEFAILVVELAVDLPRSR